jgi:hypothetical protein
VPKTDMARHARAGGSRHHPSMHGHSNRRDCSMCGGWWTPSGINNHLGVIREEMREEVDDYCSCEHCTSGNPLIWSEVRVVDDGASAPPSGRHEHTLDQYLTQLAIKKTNTSDTDTVSVLSEATSSDLGSWDMVSGAADEDSCFSDYSMIMPALDSAMMSEEEASS